MTERIWPCRKCGFFNSDGDKKCPNCGSPNATIQRLREALELGLTPIGRERSLHLNHRDWREHARRALADTAPAASEAEARAVTAEKQWVADFDRGRYGPKPTSEAEARIRAEGVADFIGSIPARNRDHAPAEYREVLDAVYADVVNDWLASPEAEKALAAALPAASRQFRPSRGGLYEHHDGTWNGSPDYEWAARQLAAALRNHRSD